MIFFEDSDRILENENTLLSKGDLGGFFQGEFRGISPEI
jgi:nitrogen regulatory protein PII-like uncharacterized protein